MSPNLLILAVAATALLACSSRRPASATVASQETSSGTRVITREMIAKWNVTDAFEVIERSGGYRLSDNDRGGVSVRQRRGQTSITNGNADRPALLVDGTIMRDFVMLRQISAAEIERIEFLSSPDAAQRYGTSSSAAGAIIVVTRRGRL